MSVLSREQIIELGLVDGASPDQFQPNGVDLTLGSIDRFDAIYGRGGINSVGKVLPRIWESRPNDGYNTFILQQGAYLVRYGETLNLPKDVCAFVYPRSTLMRCGAMIHTAVWDAGYTGRGQGLLVVHHPQGIYLERGIPIAQVVFHRLEQQTTTGYDGSYQGEGLDPSIPDRNSQKYMDRQYHRCLEPKVVSAASVVDLVD